MKDLKELPWLRVMIIDMLVELSDQVPEILVELIEICAKSVYHQEPFPYFIE